jgi:Flp pilus assembly protein TadG
MLRKFLNDVRGDYMIATAIAIVPIIGGLALAVDYAEMTRQRTATLNALDAAAIATARQVVSGASDEEAKAYAIDFFRANMGNVDTSHTKFGIYLPSSESGGGMLAIEAVHKYNPYFLGAFTSFIGNNTGMIEFSAKTTVRLKNTLEVALALDNSGSMDATGSGSGKKRLVLLKEAAKQLVNTIAAEGAQLKQVDKPVQFSLVPFAGTVNVGRENANASWMDTDGRSPVHHENFNWSTMTGNKQVQLSGGVYYKVGSDWGAEAGQKVTRFSMFNDLKRITGQNWVSDWQYVCTAYRSNGSCRTYGWVDQGGYQPTYDSYAKWEGCVETRPHPYAYDTTSPTSAIPATYFVPMFAPDETDLRDGSNRAAMGNWWPDLTTSTNNATRQAFMPKYFAPAPEGTSAAGMYQGPNAMCSTTPILPLTDVSTSAGLKKVTDAIDAMVALGATDIPEGAAWGWRTLSSNAPFTEGRPESERGNDKVLIILTDGFNTYYTPNSLGYNDLANNRSIYSNKGYTGKGYNGGSTTRLFMNAGVNSGTFTNTNYTAAMNAHLDTVCESAKGSGVIVMTVSLDLSTSNTDERGAIEAMTRCASDSRFRKDPSDPSKAAKLFWNAKGGNLAESFKEIADELSNLRIVG